MIGIFSGTFLGFFLGVSGNVAFAAVMMTTDDLLRLGCGSWGNVGRASAANETWRQPGVSAVGYATTAQKD